MSADVEFYDYPADNIPKEFDNKFDLVISLGNTFANISEENFTTSIRRCYDILKPNGQLIIQILNYKKILRDKQRIVNITESKNTLFIRFYDFYNEQIAFNILTFKPKSSADSFT